MPRIAHTVLVDAPVAVAFAVSQTQGEARYRWDPFVREQRLLDGVSRPGPGVRTFTRSRHHLTMVSQYTAFQPPSHVGMRMLEGPWFLSSMSGGWNFREADGGRTEATWRYNFVVRPRWLAPIGDRIGTWLLGRDIRRRIDSFARACTDPAVLAGLESTEHTRGERR